MIRLFELIFSLLILLFLLIPLIILLIIIKLSSDGSVIHWSKRIGQKNSIFLMPKFRTMAENTPDVATHLLKDPDQYLTRIGKFLRKYSLDEIPQLYSILLGKMTFVGPRPALFNQKDLIDLRTKLGIHNLKPGITGWAQINGRDNLTIKQKVDYDFYYYKNKNIILDLKIIFMTLHKILLKKNISH